MPSKRPTSSIHVSDCPAAPAHHWLIEQQGHGIDAGVCLYCGGNRTWDTRILPEFQLKTQPPVERPEYAREEALMADER
jgi:hypothetical protein